MFWPPNLRVLVDIVDATSIITLLIWVSLAVVAAVTLIMRIDHGFLKAIRGCLRYRRFFKELRLRSCVIDAFCWAANRVSHNDHKQKVSSSSTELRQYGRCADDGFAAWDVLLQSLNAVVRKQARREYRVVPGEDLTFDYPRRSHSYIPHGRQRQRRLGSPKRPLHHSQVSRQWDTNFGRFLSLSGHWFDALADRELQDGFRLGMPEPEGQQYRSVTQSYVTPFINIGRKARTRPRSQTLFEQPWQRLRSDRQRPQWYNARNWAHPLRRIARVINDQMAVAG
ncbi:hypothetical protein [Rhodopila sp.]|uniref:hypothetical protein n=1 Tax=Rhodopila sp. TaxID=2480087 RepID=UPI003D0E3977